MTIRVYPPEITERAGMLELSARVRSEAFPAGVPERMSWLVRRDSGLAFSDRSDAFLVALLPIAMRLGQNLEIEGAVSTRLAHGSASYQDILSAWWPRAFSHIEVSATAVDPRTADLRPAGVGCCFSGGVDSFNALIELRPPVCRYPAFRMTHALMINGFDQIVDLDHTGVSERMQQAYRKALEPWDVRLEMIHSNLKLFRDAVFRKHERVRSFGSPLTASAHAVSPVFGRFNLSGHATYRYEDLKPNGAHPALDHHLSTDQLQVIHLGASLSRSEKIERMALEGPVRAALRVCFGTPEFTDTGEVTNCGRCEKCIRTIAILDMIGELENFPTFRRRVDIRAYKDPRVLHQVPQMFLHDLIRAAERHGRNAWLPALKHAEALKQQAAAQSAVTPAGRR